jgi:regulator of RNase E activity RraB
MNKRLLREFYELCEGGSCPDILTEAEKKFVASGGVILSGKLQEADAKNGNGRIYPKKILEREMKNYQKLVDENRALGELDHPDDSVINLKNASHMITEVWWDKSNPNAVMGKIKVLDTPSGKILQELSKAGVKLGISSRGLGSVTEDKGDTIVEDDFQLICFDMVSEPSTNDAFMVMENKQFGNPNIFTKSDKIWRALNEVLKDE